MSRTVTLEDYEYEWASHVGMRRMIARKDSRPARHYAEADRLQSEIVATVATCVCELAAAKAMNRYWGGHAWDARDHRKYQGLADVGVNIEVRRVRTEGKPFAVRHTDVTLGRIMVATHWAGDAEPNKVTVYGYMPAEEAWALGEPSSFDPDNTRYTALNYLTPL